MTRLFLAEDFVHIGRGHKLRYVDGHTEDVLTFCPKCKKLTFFKYLRSFSLNGVWKGIYACKECEINV